MTGSQEGYGVVRAGAEHTQQVADLFDDYRVFYGQPSDPEAARAFVAERLDRQDSIIYLAHTRSEGTKIPLGFTQLYPSFSSVSMKPLWILNDLYVAAEGRRQGVGRALIDRARELAVETGAKGLILETTIDNAAAQALYDSYGFVKDTEFYRYALDI